MKDEESIALPLDEGNRNEIKFLEEGLMKFRQVGDLMFINLLSNGSFSDFRKFPYGRMPTLGEIYYYIINRDGEQTRRINHWIGNTAFLFTRKYLYVQDEPHFVNNHILMDKHFLKSQLTSKKNGVSLSTDGKIRRIGLDSILRSSEQFVEADLGVAILGERYSSFLPKAPISLFDNQGYTSDLTFVPVIKTTYLNSESRFLLSWDGALTSGLSRLVVERNKNV